MKKPYNNLRYGIWIDHKKAIIISEQENGSLTSQIFKSGLASRARYRGEVTSKTGLFRHTLNAELHTQNKENNDFQKFLREVIKTIQRPSALLIMGPGDARHELENALRKQKTMLDVWVVNRAADSMTMPQLRDLVKAHYSTGG